MLIDGTEQYPTVDSAVPAFEAFLSSQEDPEHRETPPAEAPKAEPEPTDTETGAEPVEVEGEIAETPEEQPDAPETPESDSLDPNLKVRVKANGEELEVTLDEALKGYSRTANYTRDKQALAEHRKAFEGEQTAVREERARYATYLTQLEEAITQTTPKEPDWAKLQQENPTGFPAEFAKWQVHKQEMDDLKAEKERAQGVVAADQQKLREKHLEGETARLLEIIPEWKDPEAAKAEKAKLVAYAEKTYGFTPEELGNVVDHRPLVLLRKAMLWDAMQANKPVVQARIQKVIAATPGASVTPKVTPEATKARQRLAKTGRMEDAAAAFEAMLPD